MSGVCSAGLATTVLPATSAAAIWPMKIARGKFHGEIATKTPRPRRRRTFDSPVGSRHRRPRAEEAAGLERHSSGRSRPPRAPPRARRRRFCRPPPAGGGSARPGAPREGRRPSAGPRSAARRESRPRRGILPGRRRWRAPGAPRASPRRHARRPCGRRPGSGPAAPRRARSRPLTIGGSATKDRRAPSRISASSASSEARWPNSTPRELARPGP